MTLTDIQAILLSAAVQRENWCLLPFPTTLAGKDDQSRKAVQQLIKRGLVAETRTTSREATFREEGDLRFAAIITDAGKLAIGAIDADTGDTTPESPPSPKSPRPTTKQAKVVELLQREQGASIAEIVEATGWLPHTTRAALTGLRKRSISLNKTKVDGVTRYTVVIA